VPFLSKCYFNFVANYQLPPMSAVLDEVIAYLNRTPWWRLRPHRHLFFFMSGIGAGIVPSWRAHLSSSIFLVAEGDREADYFRYAHDIVVPGKVSVEARNRSQVLHGKRRLLAMFRGSLTALLRDSSGSRVKKPNKLRQWLAERYKHHPKILVSGFKSAKHVRQMDSSTFCLIPRGNTPWTRRFFDAALRGCIPVVMSNPVSFPFERLIDYSQLALKLPEEWVPRLAAELEAVTPPQLRQLREHLLLVAAAFVYNGGFAYEMILLELAARKHAFFKRWKDATRNSPVRFWTPGQGRFIVDSTAKVGPSYGAAAAPH